jgi:hypothetical protein
MARSMGVVLLALGVYAYMTYKTELSGVSSFAPFLLAAGWTSKVWPLRSVDH